MATTAPRHPPAEPGRLRQAACDKPRSSSCASTNSLSGTDSSPSKWQQRHVIDSAPASARPSAVDLPQNREGMRYEE